VRPARFPDPEGRPISPTLTNLVILAGVAAVAVFLRLAVLTGRTDDAANDARWAELTGIPVAVTQPSGPLSGVLSGIRRLTEFVTGERPRPVPVERTTRLP
jgi:hypothetical protein